MAIWHPDDLVTCAKVTLENTIERGGPRRTVRLLEPSSQEVSLMNVLVAYATRHGATAGIAERIAADLGPDTPWHVSGYYPAYRFSAPPTPVSAQERAWRIGREAGLRFVYLGNVLGHRLENTYCPDCGALLIERWGLRITIERLERGRCPDCGRAVPGCLG